MGKFECHCMYILTDNEIYFHFFQETMKSIPTEFLKKVSLLKEEYQLYTHRLVILYKMESNKLLEFWVIFV